MMAAPANNTLCQQAKNGVCDEGRNNHQTGLPDVAELEVFCDLGTDCSDCGSWHGVQHSKAWTEKELPVEMLQRMKIKVYVRRTSTYPHFLMPYTWWQHDIDVSGQMHAHSGVELGETRVFYEATWRHCMQPTRGLVLDVGANFGWYSLFSAAMGCRVIAWEPVPHFRAFFEYGLALNGFQDLVQVRPAVVARDMGRKHNLTVPQRGIWGTASVDGANVDPWVDNQGDYMYIEVVGERIDKVVSEDVALLKVDVESFEPMAFASASGLFLHHTVHNVFLEYSPGVAERHRWLNKGKATPAVASKMRHTPQMLLSLIRYGLTLLHMPDYMSKAGNFKAPVPVLRTITAENVMYDIQDVDLFLEDKLGCKVPEFLSKNFSSFGSCNSMPQDLHPRGFRGCFGYNTNIWGARDPPAWVVGGHVSILPPNETAPAWFSVTGFGSAGASCNGMDPKWQVRNHCRCSKPEVCGEEEKAVEEAAKAGLMPQLFSLKAKTRQAGDTAAEE